MKITNKMVTEFNQHLEIANCIFRLCLGDSATPGNTNCEIILANKIFVDSFIINPNEEFYTMLEYFFKQKGIKLNYNNTRTIFWSMNGWEEN